MVSLTPSFVPAAECTVMPVCLRAPEDPPAATPPTPPGSRARTPTPFFLKSGEVRLSESVR